jgi:uncharacterized protein
MKSKASDPLRLDVAAAAADSAVLDGRWPMESLPRLAVDAVVGSDLDATYRARFEERRPPGGAPQPWLHLTAQAQVTRQCQRCLEPVLLSLSVDRWFAFAASEEDAAAQDADSDDDVLAVSARFDLRALVEDELLLALPLVPRHEVCPQPLTAPGAAADDRTSAPAAHPFAALAALKRGKGH